MAGAEREFPASALSSGRPQLSYPGDLGFGKELAGAPPYSLVRERGRTPDFTRAFSILPPAWKQSPGSLQAAPRELLLEDRAAEPRIRGQARCRAEERQRRGRWTAQREEAGRMGGGQKGI